MRQTIEGLRKMAERLKLLTALGALFMSGALIAIALTGWYYDRVISQIHGSYGGRIAAHNKDMRRVVKELDAEREVTRSQLEEQARDIDKLSDDMARLITMIEQTSKTAAQAASTARQAANTAQGAAANAAKSRIRVTEVPPKKNQFEQRIEP